MIERPPRASLSVVASLAMLASIAACGARPARPLVLLPDEPIASITTPSPAPDAPLADDDVVHDLALVIDVLEHEHEGRAFVTPDTFASLRARFGEITRRSHTAQSFCDALGSALTSLIDPSVRVSLDRDLAHRCRGDEGTGGGIPYGGSRMGEGIAAQAAPLHAVRVEIAQVPVVVLGIRAFASEDDPAWADLGISLAAAQSTNAVVIDLRGARGSDPWALASLLAAFTSDAPLTELHVSSTPRGVAMRAAARELGLGEPASVEPALRRLAQPFPPRAIPLAEIKRDIIVLIDDACEEACEVVARVLQTHARAQVFGQVSWQHRLSAGDPGVLVLPHTGVRLAVPLRAVLVTREIGRVTGDRGSWFDRRGYGGLDAPTEHDDILPSAVRQVAERAARRARIARLSEAPVPDCATFPRAASIESMPIEAQHRLENLHSHEASSRALDVWVDLPPLSASQLLRTCPGLHVMSVTPIGEPGLQQTIVHVTYDELLDITRLVVPEAVSRILLREPMRDHIDTE